MTSLLLIAAVALSGAAPAASAPTAPSVEERLIRLDDGQRFLERDTDELKRRVGETGRRIAAQLDELRSDATERLDKLHGHLSDSSGRLGEINRGVGDLVTQLQLLIGLIATLAVGIFSALIVLWRRLATAESDIKILRHVRLRTQIVQR